MGILSAAGKALYSFASGLGGPGLLLIALADSSFLSLPEGNDILIVVLSIGKPWDMMLYYVLMTVIGSVAGCSLLYSVGRRGGGFVERKMSGSRLERIRGNYQKRGVMAVVIPSILPPPMPFKIFVLAAGVFRLPFGRFLAAVAVGRSFRYLMWGTLAVLYGEAAKRFLEERIQTVGIVLAVVLVLGVVVYLGLRSRARSRSGSYA